MGTLGVVGCLAVSDEVKCHDFPLCFDILLFERDFTTRTAQTQYFLDQKGNLMTEVPGVNCTMSESMFGTLEKPRSSSTDSLTDSFRKESGKTEKRLAKKMKIRYYEDNNLQIIPLLYRGGNGLDKATQEKRRFHA